MGVLDEGACVTIEVNRLLRIEKHILAGIDFQDKVLQGTHTDNAGNLLLLGFRHIGVLASLITHTTSIFYHQLHQVVSINYSAFATLHLAIGKLHHAVREVHQFLTPLEAQTVQQNAKHLEVVVLLIAYDIDHLVYGIVLEAHLGSTDILCHIDGSTVRA